MNIFGINFDKRSREITKQEKGHVENIDRR